MLALFFSIQASEGGCNYWERFESNQLLLQNPVTPITNQRWQYSEGRSGITLSTNAACATVDNTANPQANDEVILTTSCSAPPQWEIACSPLFVGDYFVFDGPFWLSNPPTYTCVEACALNFGGVADDYACSTERDAINNLAWTSTWGVRGCNLNPENYKNDDGDGRYNCGSFNCSTSAWVRDNCSDSGRNYCFAKSNPTTRSDLYSPAPIFPSTRNNDTSFISTSGFLNMTEDERLDWMNINNKNEKKKKKKKKEN